jgi:hypothetical protein
MNKHTHTLSHIQIDMTTYIFTRDAQHNNSYKMKKTKVENFIFLSFFKEFSHHPESLVPLQHFSLVGNCSFESQSVRKANEVVHSMVDELVERT